MSEREGDVGVSVGRPRRQETAATLRELVDAWQVRLARTSEAFDSALAGINRELDAVGGYATTSPDKGGYCRSYVRSADGFGGGVERSGELNGDRATPHCPEVGDRCAVLEAVWRAEALASTVATHAVRARVAEVSGIRVDRLDRLAANGIGPEHVALALLRELP